MGTPSANGTQAPLRESGEGVRRLRWVVENIFENDRCDHGMCIERIGGIIPPSCDEDAIIFIVFIVKVMMRRWNDGGRGRNGGRGERHKKRKRGRVDVDRVKWAVVDCKGDMGGWEG